MISQEERYQSIPNIFQSALFFNSCFKSRGLSPKGSFSMSTLQPIKSTNKKPQHTNLCPDTYYKETSEVPHLNMPSGHIRFQTKVVKLGIFCQLLPIYQCLDNTRGPWTAMPTLIDIEEIYNLDIKAPTVPIGHFGIQANYYTSNPQQAKAKIGHRSMAFCQLCCY